MADTRGVTLNIADIVDRSAWRGLSVLVLVLCILVLTADGLDANMLSLAIPALMDAWSVPRADFAPVMAVHAFGMAAGSVFGGALGDIFGRRRMVIASVLLFSTTTFAVVFIDNVSALFVLRALCSLGLGALFPTVTALLAEFTPARHRAKAISLLHVSPPGGGMLAGLLGVTVLTHYGWEPFFYIAGFGPLFLLLFVIAALPESPRFLVRRNDPSGRLENIVRQLDPTVPKDAQLVETREEEKPRPVSALLEPEFRRNTIALCAAFFFLNLMNVTYLNWLPTLLTSAGLGLESGGWTLTGSAAGAIFAGLISGFVVERIGSRTLLIYAACAVFLVIATMSLVPLTDTGVHVLIALSAVKGVCVGMMQISLYTAAVNVFPTTIKGSGLGLASGVGRLGAIASGYAILVMDMGGDWTFFGMLAIGSAAIFIAALFIERKPRASST